MDPERGLAFLPEVKRLLEGTSVALPEDALRAFRAEHQPYYMNGEGAVIDSGEPERQKYVMVLPLRGAIIRNDVNCGPIGCETRAKWLRQADNDPDCLGVVLDTDTPGGEGSGMRVMIQQLERMRKPVITYVNNGMLCSAGMGIGAATKEIVLSHSSDIVGSIGTYVTLTDWIKHFEEHLQLVMHQVYATASTEKNRPFLEALKANHKDAADPHYKLLRDQIIDPFNQSFIAHVQKHRPQAKDQDGVFNGRVFFGDDAVRLGLADRYGTLEDCIDTVRRQASVSGKPSTGRTTSAANSATNASISTENNPDTNIDTDMSKIAKVVAALAAALGFDSKEEVTSENITEANAALKEKGIDTVALVSVAEQQQVANAAKLVSDANAAKTAAEQAKVSAEQAKTEAESKVGALETEKTALAGQVSSLNTALEQVATTNGVKAEEGKTLVDALGAELTKVKAELATANAEVTKLRGEDAPDDRAEGVVNKEGDKRDATKNDVLSKMDHMVKIDDED